MGLKVSLKKSHGLVPVVLVDQGAWIYLYQRTLFHKIIYNLFGHLLVFELTDHIIRGRYLISCLQICVLYVF